MRLLLDTHAFLWLVDEPSKLSQRALAACEDEANEVLVSVVTAWELQIKLGLGKLRLARPLATVINEQLTLQNMKLLPIELAHVYALGELPRHHADPFDRLLIAQATVEEASLVAHDRAFASYPVKVVW